MYFKAVHLKPLLSDTLVVFIVKCVHLVRIWRSKILCNSFLLALSELYPRLNKETDYVHFKYHFHKCRTKY